MSKIQESGTLAELQSFVAIAEARSFTRAAHTLGVSPSALSHSMRALEARLGVSLLARTTRSVAPTQAGLRLLATLRPAFEDISNGLKAVGDLRERPSGTVRITTFRHAAKSVLMPVLPCFFAAHPEVRVEIAVDDHLVDIVAAGYDAGIRWADAVDKDMVAVTVGKPTRLAVVGSPAYFGKHPIPRKPRDLLAHRCMTYRLPSGRIYAIELERNGRIERVKAEGPLIVNDGELALRAALDADDMPALAAACGAAGGPLKAMLRRLLHYHLGTSTLRTRDVLRDVQRLLGPSTAIAPAAS